MRDITQSCWVYNIQIDVVDKEGRTSGQSKWLSLTPYIPAGPGGEQWGETVFLWKSSLQNTQGFQGTERGFADSLLPKDTKVGLTQAQQPTQLQWDPELQCHLWAQPGVFGSCHPLFLTSGPITHPEHGNSAPSDHSSLIFKLSVFKLSITCWLSVHSWFTLARKGKHSTPHQMEMKWVNSCFAKGLLQLC